jgi:hypothetical protein
MIAVVGSQSTGKIIIKFRKKFFTLKYYWKIIPPKRKGNSNKKTNINSISSNTKR